ncbi:MAG TPA: amidohydrolase family protein, partial [Planctomycetota bacterium]|nr:amidohydrolase family protein [Planctomycetota bacterium]
MIRFALLVVAVLPVGCTSPGPRGPADLIVHHAKVLTVDSGFSIREAIAVKDGRIAAVGEDQEIFTWAGPATRIIDAEGGTVLPGLYDSHVHITMAAWSELSGPLPQLVSLEDAFEYIRRKAAVTPEGEWIQLPFAFATRL